MITLEHSDLLAPAIKTGQPIYDYSSLKQISLMVDATDKCQLGCVYCYFGEKGCKMMDPEKLFPAITKFVTAMGPQIEALGIHYMGGEPLIGWQQILELNARLKSFYENSSVKFGWSMTSNLVSLNEEKMQHMIAENAGIHCSIDGPQEVHDQNRPFLSGAGSFTTVDKKIELALKISPHDTARATITPYSSHHLPEITEYLFSKGFKKIGLFPAYNLDWQEDDYQAWKEGIRSSYQIAFKQKKQLSSVLRIKHKSEPKFNYCGAGKGLWAMNTDGVLYNCHHLTKQPEYLVIDTSQASVEEIKAAIVAKNFSPLTITIPEKCKECPARSYCGGGCWAENIANTGSAYLPEKVSCTFRQLTFEAIASYLEPEQSRFAYKSCDHCYNCEHCDECQNCQRCEGCISCDTCQRCDSCQKCDYCDTCQRCDSSCDGCDECQNCQSCQFVICCMIVCDGCQGCEGCEGCVDCQDYGPCFCHPSD